MTEPTLDEMLEWLETAISVEKKYNGKDDELMRAAIRAILDEYRDVDDEDDDEI